MGEQQKNNVDYKKLRKKVLIDKSLQYKFVWKAYIPVLIVILIGMVAILLSLYFVDSKTIMKYDSTMDILQDFDVWFKGMKDAGGFFGKYKYLVIGGAILTAILMFGYISWIFIYFSHRIVGPLFRMQKVFENVLKGDLSIRIKFRDKDEFQDLADNFNRMIEGLGDRYGEMKDLVLAIEKAIDKQKASSKDCDFEEIEELLAKLKENINYFKLEE